MSSYPPEVVIGVNAINSISQISNSAIAIGSHAGSVICQLPNNATSLGQSSLSSISQMSYKMMPAGNTPSAHHGINNVMENNDPITLQLGLRANY